MYLYVWKGDFGLPTLQLECLQVLTYCKMANIPVEVRYRKYPVWNCGWKMPIFQDNSVQLSGAAEIIKYLRKTFVPNVSLTPLQSSETMAFVNMLESKLKPAIQFLWWLDVQNFEGLTRKWFWHLMPFPLSHFYVNNRRTYAETCSDCMFLMDDDMQLRKNALYKNCDDCFEIIAAKLKDNSGYFCSDKVTDIDSALYAYLAPIWKIPFPSDQLKKSLLQYHDIIKYLEKLSKKFYPGLNYEDRFGLVKHDLEVDTEALSKINVFMAFAMVSVTMVAYGVSHGIIKWPLVKLPK